MHLHTFLSLCFVFPLQSSLIILHTCTLHRCITAHPYTYENLPQAPSLLLPSSMSALLDGCPSHTHIDSLSMSLVSIHLNYLCHTILDHLYCAAISIPLDNGYFTCFIDLLVSNAPLHSDVVLSVDWLSIVHESHYYFGLVYFLAWSQILIPTSITYSV